jgi:hypothetical protein
MAAAQHRVERAVKGRWRRPMIVRRAGSRPLCGKLSHVWCRRPAWGERLGYPHELHDPGARLPSPRARTDRGICLPADLVQGTMCGFSTRTKLPRTKAFPS